MKTLELWKVRGKFSVGRTWVDVMVNPVWCQYWCCSREPSYQRQEGWNTVIKAENTKIKRQKRFKRYFLPETEEALKCICSYLFVHLHNERGKTGDEFCNLKILHIFSSSLLALSLDALSNAQNTQCFHQSLLARGQESPQNFTTTN